MQKFLIVDVSNPDESFTRDHVTPDELKKAGKRKLLLFQLSQDEETVSIYDHLGDEFVELKRMFDV